MRHHLDYKVPTDKTVPHVLTNSEEFAVMLIEIDRRRLVFTVVAHDGTDEICRGRHERFIIDAETFKAIAAAKA